MADLKESQMVCVCVCVCVCEGHVEICYMATRLSMSLPTHVQTFPGMQIGESRSFSHY